MIKLFTKKRKGFTLLELILVVVILGILAVVAVPRFLGSTENAKKSAHDSNVVVIESAAELAAVSGVTVEQINVKKLVDDGYLSNTPKYPFSNAEYTVTVTEEATSSLGSRYKIEVKPAREVYNATGSAGGSGD